MKDRQKTKPQLVDELEELRQKVSRLEAVEGELRRSEERLELALHGADLGLWDYNLQTGEAFVNARRAEMVGYSVEELEPHFSSWGQLIHPDDLVRVTNTINAHLEGRTPFYVCEHRLRHKSGQYIWILARGKVVERDEQGNPVRMVGTSLDITGRKRTEEALLLAHSELERRVKERTAELESSEAKYKILVEESFDGIFVQKWAKIAFTNSRVREMLGYEEGELEGQDHWLVYHPEYREVTREGAEALLRGEPVPARHEVRMQRKGGTCFEAEINARAVEFDGEPAVQVWIRDISERKQAENALRESEERFKAAFQTNPDPVSITRLSDGVFIEANDGFTKLSGFTREEVIGKSSLEMNLWYDPGDRDRLIAELHKRRYATNLEARFRMKDGRVRTGLASASIVVLNGEPHLLMVTRDVEDWKKAEQALRESEEKYRTLFEDSKDPVIMTTRDGVVEDANQAFLDLFGFSREELRDMDILKIYLDHEDRRRFQQDIERDGSVKDYPAKRRKKDGTEIDCLLTSTVRRDKNGKVLGYQGIIRDVTERKQLERQLLQAQKMEAVGQLAGGVAHDFNNILTAIIGYSDVLTRQMPEDSPYLSKLMQINRAGARAAHLTRQLLAFSRKQILDLRPLNLNKVLANFEKMLRPLIGEDIEVDTFLDPSAGTVMGDATQMEQILLNLAVNARDAMPRGGKLTMETANVSLDETYARTHSEVRPGPYVMLTVSDTGHGIDPHVLPHVFDPFFTTKGKDKGTGLGLSTVYGIVKQHQGHITAYSEPGRGTTFKVYMPRVQKPSEEATSVPAATSQLIGNETVLLVEDDELVRQLTSEVLERLGYSVLLCRDPEEAIRVGSTYGGPIHLLLTDVVLPQMDGKTLYGFLSPLFPDMRVLYVSGYAENAIFHHGVLDPGVKFLQKPFTLDSLGKKIREVLDDL